MTEEQLKSLSGSKVRILFDRHEVLAELHAGWPGLAFLTFQLRSPSRVRHVLSAADVAGLSREAPGVLASDIALNSLEGNLAF